MNRMPTPVTLDSITQAQPSATSSITALCPIRSAGAGYAGVRSLLLEHLQMTGSFKERGAEQTDAPERSREECGVIAASARIMRRPTYHGQQLQIRSPSSCPVGPRR
jgi:threonine dehydratase